MSDLLTAAFRAHAALYTLVHRGSPPPYVRDACAALADALGIIRVPRDESAVRVVEELSTGSGSDGGWYPTTQIAPDAPRQPGQDATREAPATTETPEDPNGRQGGVQRCDILAETGARCSCGQTTPRLATDPAGAHWHAGAPEAAPAPAGLRDQIAAALEAADYRMDMRRGDLADAVMPVVQAAMGRMPVYAYDGPCYCDTAAAHRRAETAEAAIARVHHLHVQRGDRCAVCAVSTADYGRLWAPWPCDTVRALDGTDTPEEPS